MGDKSPKSKQRDQKQKTLASKQDSAQAQAKRDSNTRAPQISSKGKK